MLISEPYFQGWRLDAIMIHDEPAAAGHTARQARSVTDTTAAIRRLAGAAHERGPTGLTCWRGAQFSCSPSCRFRSGWPKRRATSAIAAVLSRLVRSFAAAARCDPSPGEFRYATATTQPPATGGNCGASRIAIGRSPADEHDLRTGTGGSAASSTASVLRPGGGRSKPSRGAQVDEADPL